jgi:hypothetical protein
MYDIEEHLDDLVRHIDLVRQAGLLLAKRLIDQGRVDLGRMLLGNIYVHDASKFAGIEWKFLHTGPDTPKEQMKLAVEQHVETNTHHPECHGGFQNMPELCIAEMVCDWKARSVEFGTSLRDWIKKEAISKYNIDIKSEKYEQMMGFVNLLLKDSFVRG